MIIRHNVRTVNIGQLRRNLQAIKSVLPKGTLLMAVVKADAYGHGMATVAHMARESGADQLAVATPEEGITLREHGFEMPILVMGAAFQAGIEACIEADLTQTVMDAKMVALIDEEAEWQEKVAKIHIKIDTGMNRIGLGGEETLRQVLSAIRGREHIVLTGVYTHFADADGEDEAFTKRQYEIFLRLTRDLPKNVLRHSANSAATLRHPEMCLDMVRVGIALYGCPPVKTALPLLPALSWTCEVTHLKTVPKGESVSYGRTYTASKDTLVATLCVGYGDGFHRALSGRGRVLIGGEYADIIGRVCMDQTMVDVTGIKGVAVGSEAVIIGTQGGKTITPDDVAKAADTISYEVLLAPTCRVPRVYIDE